MAVEAKRGCGYRKVGGLYIVGGTLGAPCCKLPIPLKVCPCCGGGVKQTRGWTWIDPQPWLQAQCTGETPSDLSFCPAAYPERLGKRVGLLWIGAQFYPKVDDFMREANDLGISRRITAVPKGFKLGEHWVFLAHPHVVPEKSDDLLQSDTLGPGIFRIFRPSAIEKIVTETMAKDEAEMEKLRRQGVTPVIVPDDDPDHQGTVYDQEEDDSDALL